MDVVRSQRQARCCCFDKAEIAEEWDALPSGRFHCAVTVTFYTQLTPLKPAQKVLMRSKRAVMTSSVRSRQRHRLSSAKSSQVAN